ncbi:hypothetical protein [Glutamicibacter sp. X7]
MTVTGYQKKIMSAVPGMKKSKAEKLAHKIAKRAADMQEQFDFYEALRILGVISDPTARDAIRNTEKAVEA